MVNRIAGDINWARFPTEAGFSLASFVSPAFGSTQLLVHWVQGKRPPHVKRPLPDTDRSPHQVTRLRMRGATHIRPRTPHAMILN
jgi:hypothetical protein